MATAARSNGAPTSKRGSFVPILNASTKMLVSDESIFTSAIAPKNPRTVPTPTSAVPSRSTSRSTCDLLEPLRHRVSRDPRQPDGSQHQAEHANPAICLDSELRGRSAAFQVFAERLDVEDIQTGIDESNLVPNAAQGLGSRIRPHHNRNAAGGRPC